MGMVKASGAVALGICLIVLAGLCVFGVPSAPAAQFEIKLGHSDPPDIYTSRKAAGSTVFKAMVENETGLFSRVSLDYVSCTSQSFNLVALNQSKTAKVD